VNNDIYLLCSDGLHGMVSLDDLIDTLLQTEAELGEAVAERLLALAKAGGGKDNISVITINVQEKT
jgi:protein phosphatase